MGDEYDNLVFTAYEDQQHENDQGTSSSSSSKVLISADNIHFAELLFNWYQTSNFPPGNSPSNAKRIRNVGCYCGRGGHFLGRWGQCPEGHPPVPISEQEKSKSRKVKKPRKKVYIAPIALLPEEVEVSQTSSSSSRQSDYCELFMWATWRSILTVAIDICCFERNFCPFSWLHDRK